MFNFKQLRDQLQLQQKAFRTNREMFGFNNNSKY